MNNQLEMRQQINGILSQTVANLINQGASFTMMEDALYKILLEVKDGAHREFIASITTSPENIERQEEEESQEEE